jgi:hypothetical protein
VISGLPQSRWQAASLPRSCGDSPIVKVLLALVEGLLNAARTQEDLLSAILLISDKETGFLEKSSGVSELSSKSPAFLSVPAEKLPEELRTSEVVGRIDASGNAVPAAKNALFSSSNLRQVHWSRL